LPSNSSPKELKEELREAILACKYYRDKYLKRLRLLALAARSRLVAPQDVSPPANPRTTAYVPRDPEMEYAATALSHLERIVGPWQEQTYPDSEVGRSHKEMELLQSGIQLDLFLPLPE
jgi:hypothetical protein